MLLPLTIRSYEIFLLYYGISVHYSSPVGNSKQYSMYAMKYILSTFEEDGDEVLLYHHYEISSAATSAVNDQAS